MYRDGQTVQLHEILERIHLETVFGKWKQKQGLLGKTCQKFVQLWVGKDAMVWECYQSEMLDTMELDRTQIVS